MKKLQIGVIGSMLDVKVNDSLKEIARNLGREIARKDMVLVFGFEGDFESLSAIAAVGAQEAGGETVAFIWGPEKVDMGILNSTRVITGQHRGGGREYSLILSCDGLISIGGGSGTLMEIAMAYQANIPIVSLAGSGGWSDKLADSFLDDRKRLKVKGAKNSKEAVDLAIELIEKT